MQSQLSKEITDPKYHLICHPMELSLHLAYMGLWNS